VLQLPAAAARPDSPSAYLVEAVGQFRFHLGAAPGVGKTYALLTEANAAASGAPTSSPGSSRPAGGHSPRS